MENTFKKISPKIIFVDAPTAFGKDYFIDKFIEQLEKKHPDLVIESLRATDITLTKSAKTEDRKYTIYTTEEEKINNIYLGHINLLCYLNEVLNSTTKDVDVVVVNRSFLSFLNYNVYPHTETQSGSQRIINIVNQYIETYTRLFSNLFYNTPTLMVRLTLHGNLDNVCNTIIDRIKNRNDNKAIDNSWIKYIVTRYNVIDPRLEKLFGFNEIITSSDSKYILNKYF